MAVLRCRILLHSQHRLLFRLSLLFLSAFSRSGPAQHIPACVAWALLVCGGIAWRGCGCTYVYKFCSLQPHLAATFVHSHHQLRSRCMQHSLSIVSVILSIQVYMFTWFFPTPFIAIHWKYSRIILGKPVIMVLLSQFTSSSTEF